MVSPSPSPTYFFQTFPNLKINVNFTLDNHTKSAIIETGGGEKVVKENEFILEDRKMKVRSLIEQYGEENCYISYSGGKDSTVVSKIVDLALPGNKIPRVYKDTGIEYPQMREYVKSLCAKDNRFVYLKPSRNIRKTLKEIGYPFKSKQHGHNFRM